ncbi:nuclear transport factor 2 family protein [Shewanella maritima]|uniref:nuclear transport factor 2 family protein n=1 Tax=Shewanella maritima TaxID=2520507 RepID=UPI0037359A48
MTTIVNKLGFIAMLVTTVSAFDILAHEHKSHETTNTGETQALTTVNASKSIDTTLETQSEHVSQQSQQVVKPLGEAERVISSNGLDAQENQQINSLLNQLHEAAATANWQTYFDLYHPKAVFIGTDASERWSMIQFQQYAEKTSGWSYDLQSRELIKVDGTIVFDEQLYSASYGVSRGTGALVKTEAGWKVLQYHLSFPIPNEQAKRITTLIKQMR